MTRGWWMIVLSIALALAGTFSCAANKSPAAGYKTLSAAELQAKMDAKEELVIVDLREPEQYGAGHVPGAKNIPFDVFDQRMNELNAADEIVLICHNGPMGDVSGTLLGERGYARVWNVAGGMAAWGGKLEK